MIDPTCWMEEAEKIDYFNTLAEKAEEAEVVEKNGTKH